MATGSLEHFRQTLHCPASIWFKVERSSHPDTAKAQADGIGPDAPGPKGVPLAGTRFVEPLGRGTNTTIAPLLTG